MVQLDASLTLAEFIRVVRNHERVVLALAAQERLAKGRAYVERLLERGDVVYGVTTGFGKFANVRIPLEKARELQRNLLLSHAIGVGEPFPTEVVRGMLLLRAQSLALGYSGVRPVVVERLVDFLNHNIHPVVPSQGSVGASGDLAPLAHMALPLIGEGEVEYQGRVRPAREVLREVGLEPLVLEAKEGLALINGTQAMTSLLALLVWDAEVLLKTADVAAAMSVEALKGSHKPFDPAVPRLRPHLGARAVAENLRKLLADSEIERSHANCSKVQDAYSLRAVPQVHGASRDAMRHVREVVERELVSVTDNPLVLWDEGRVISAGNFHGQPLALAADYAGIALAELANISERRVEQMLNPALSGLPAFLAEQGGLHSGLMISQYTAASLVSENKVLAHPASVDSIPTSANQEDHVSMGTHACRKAHQIYENTLWVLAIELASAAQALDFHKPLRPGKGVAAVYRRIREEVPHLDRDRYLRPELERLRQMIRAGEIIAVAESAVGALA
ncbi:histidine ammonia-lyase [Marinithermus hydrothermalis]|uniref:Histidine ammonia-lyase n=1 Tax=Marinithermus hydrothermalis (strain DSM 14884 / JCM 11576 / T1) TaxID=869210 RepID=F2NLD0_MARHT|nr:histidine ammonia-lyase [Marinithermus hydrothermalis]AEB11749.1 Histidine ammonia-lyase [Marinithermus hydrothermalis DSM 14884]